MKSILTLSTAISSFISQDSDSGKSSGTSSSVPGTPGAESAIVSAIGINSRLNKRQLSLIKHSNSRIQYNDPTRTESLTFCWMEEENAFHKGVLGQYIPGKDLDNKPRRISSVLLGVEGCAPGKKSPFVGVGHDTSGKSNYVSARGGRKWRAYSLNHTNQQQVSSGSLSSKTNSLPVPVDYGGMRLTLTRHQFEDFKQICQEIIDPRLEPSFVWDSLQVIARGPGTPLGLSPGPKEVRKSLPDRFSRDLISLRAHRQRLFKELLCSDATNARVLLNEAVNNKFVAGKIVEKQIKRRGKFIEDSERGEVVVKRRDSH